MCDCGCITTEDTTGYDNTAYQASTYDITGNPIDYPGYQVPAPVEVAPVPSPALLPALQPAPYEPGMSPNDALINAMQFAPPGSPEAATLASVIASQNAAAGDSLRPTHDIYGNSL